MMTLAIQPWRGLAQSWFGSMYSLSCFSFHLFVLCQIHGHAIRDSLHVEESLKEQECDFEAEQILGTRALPTVLPLKQLTAAQLNGALNSCKSGSCSIIISSEISSGLPLVSHLTPCCSTIICHFLPPPICLPLKGMLFHNHWS